MITVLEQGQVGSDTKHRSRSLTHLFWLNLGTFSSRKCFGLNYVTLLNIPYWMTYSNWATNFHQKERRKGRKNRLMLWEKLIFSGWVLIICIQWNTEQWSKTKIIYAQRLCQWKSHSINLKLYLCCWCQGPPDSFFCLTFAQRTVPWKGSFRTSQLHQQGQAELRHH